jgi:hypothetical protein
MSQPSQQQQSQPQISAEERIKTLETFSFEDNQTNIEAPTLAISLEPSLGYKYVDKNVFEFRWSEEISFLAQLVNRSERRLSLNANSSLCNHQNKIFVLIAFA